MRLRARPASGLLAAVAVALALASALHSGPHVWGRLESDEATFAAYSPAQRRQAPVSEFSIPGSIFDFFARYIAPGDRIYYQVLQSGFSESFTLPQAIVALGNYYLLPGVEATDLAHATVVVSYFANPALLHVRFITQVEAGLQPLYVSRIRAP